MQRLALLLVLAGCGGGLTPAATTSLQDAVTLNLQADQLLEGGAARALERGAYCATASVLYSYGKDVPEGGPQCLPR